jgi:hypothetical protein
MSRNVDKELSGAANDGDERILMYELILLASCRV